METKRKRFYTLLTLSFVLLFNPNITVVDIMPDFIAWFTTLHDAIASVATITVAMYPIRCFILCCSFLALMCISAQSYT